MAGGAFGDAISSDVVGYLGKETGNEGCTALGISFAAVSGTMDIQDVSVTGYEGDFGGQVYMQTLTPNGYTSATYTWVDLSADPDDPDSEAFYGWYDENDEKVSKTINPGDGFWTASDDINYKIRSAGKVVTASVAIQLGDEGCTMIANPYPTSVNIQDVAVTGYEGDFGGQVYMQTLTPNGYTSATYTWVDLAADPDDPDSEAFYGWYDENDELVTKTIIAGEGLWTASDSADYSVVFPALNL